MGALDGKVAVVTGGSRGVGAGIAVELASLGASVAVTARTVESRADDLTGTVHETAEAIEAAGSTGLAIGADLLLDDEIDRVIDTVLETFRRVDILVNNAADTGDNVFRGFAETSATSWNAQLKLNVGAYYALMKGFVPSMKANGGGLIINVGSMETFPSTAVRAGSAGMLPGGLRLGAAYPTSKVAIAAMSTLLAQELAEDNIVCLCMTPGGAKTEMHVHHATRLGWDADATTTPVAMPVKTAGYLATCANPMQYAGTFINSVAFSQEMGLV
jgi:NAD(P)-dependent dehydrogenase (short-subunit alcohol dehydrogenase family)